MFLRKVLGRTVAATATTGLLVAPLALATSPQLMNVACTDNASETTTTVALERNRAQYGTKTVVTAKNTPAPTSTDSLVEYRVSEGTRTFATFTKRAETDGSVSRLLPRGLVAGKTYDVEARFASCNWSDPVTYTVDRATADPKPTVVNRAKAKFRTTVAGGGGLDPMTGPAKFIVRKRGGGVVSSKVEFLNDGVAVANLRNLKRGRYVLKVVYNAAPASPDDYRVNKNFQDGASKVAFRVR
jgi:hypothetical protein